MRNTNTFVEDFNLLKLLVLLLEEKSVTGVARKLGVSQSAVSHKLKQLRHRFSDPLFVATKAGLIPTRRALAVGAPMAQAFRDLESATRRGADFDPKTTSRTFVVAANDYAEFAAAPTLLANLAPVAPLLRIVIAETGPRLLSELESGATDCAIGPAFRTPFDVPTLRRIRLFQERFVLIMRAGHPASSGRMTAKRLASLSHLQIAPGGKPGGPVDDALTARALQRNVVLRTPHFVSAPFIVAQSDLVMVASERLAIEAKKFAPLEVRTVPLELPQIDIFLVWHERQHYDEGHRWFRQLIADHTRRAEERTGTD